MADPITIILVASAVASAAGIAGSVVAEQNSAKAAEGALDVQAKQMDVQFEQKKAAEYQKLNANLDRQQAVAAASGTSMRSPSLAAIKLGTAKAGAQTQKNLDTEQSIARANIEAERAAIKAKLAGGLFGAIGQFGQLGGGVAQSLGGVGKGSPQPQAQG